MKRVLAYLKPFSLLVAVQVCTKFLGAVLDLLLPWALSHIIDDVVPLRNRDLIFLWGGMMLVCSVLAVVVNISANRMAASIARGSTRQLRHDLFQRTTLLSCSQIDALTVPSLEARLTTDTYNFHQMVSILLRIGVRAPILLLGGISITLSMDPVLTLVLLGVMPLICLVVWNISRNGIPLYTSTQKAVDRLVGVVRENASGVRVIKALSKAEHEKQRFDTVNRQVADCEIRATTFMATSNPLMKFFLNMGLTGVVVLGAFRVNAGLSKPGTILAFLTYFAIILGAMMSITRIFILYSKGSASANRMAEILDLPRDLPVGEREHREEEAHLSFDHVDFSYNKVQNNLTDISFSLKQGQTLGIIGPTGCGKTTIINLLMRFYDADKGTIRIGGDRVSGIPMEELRTKFGVVFQNDVLFADTIRENVDFGRNLPEERIREALRCAQADFVQDLEDGLDHMLTARGTNLSGGQKQRLLIARALAGSPEILILDDSSSALDYRTDAGLRQAIREHFDGVTTIVIAQRVSSIRHADHILVLENGRIEGQGTHEELLRSCESYREIARSQMGGEDLG